MRIGSCFSGIGGLELGLEAALPDSHVVWQIECEEFPRKVLAKHWPDADRTVTDIRQATAANCAPVDLICGGFPCQDISTAGKMRGLDGHKSSLWHDMARLIGDIRPRYIVLENVSAIASIHRGTVHGRVLGDLAQMGYHAEWHRLGASDVGALHRRWRWFLIGWLPNTQHDRQRQQQVSLSGVKCEANTQGHGQAQQVANTKSIRVEGHRTNRQQVTQAYDGEGLSVRKSARQGAAFWAVEPSMGKLANGLSTRVARSHNRSALKALGNAVVPQCAYVVGRRLNQIIEEGR